MRSVPLNRRLFLLAAVSVLPLALMAALALYVLYQQNRSQAETTGLDIARAISATVDAELRRTVAILETLDDAEALDTGDLARFEARARRTHADQPAWRAIVLADPQGRVLVHTGSAPGSAPRALAERASFERVLRERSPVIGPLSTGPAGGYAVPIRVPVVRDGKINFVLTAAVDPAHFLHLLERTRIPGEWLVSIADAGGLRVARTRSAEQSLGTPFSPSLVALMARGGDEGYGITHASEGQEVFTAYSRAPASGWTTAVGLPVARVEEGARRSFLTFGGGIVLSLVLGALAALVIARSITRPMARLRDAALDDDRRGAMDLPDTRILEIEDVARALATSEFERARGEAEREDLLKSETVARAAAEAANRAKDEFLAMLGHELRNPVGAITNAAQLMELPQLDARARAEARAIIHRQAAHLARLTDDLLDAGRAVMGKIVLQRRALDLGAAAGQALATLAASGRLGRHRIEQDLHEVWVEADPIRLDQVVANLVTNAVKYTPVEGTIRVSVRREGDEAVLTVADTGIGMSAELAARAFELFVQGDRELDRSLGGLGIGLTLVRRLAEMHGGTAEVRSEGEGRGSEFIVRLAAVEPGATQAPAAVQVHRGVAREVLVVEDNADARETLRMLLELHGHRVHTAGDGLEGVAAALRERPDAILVDVGLPGIDGYEVARRLRADDGWPRRPLLLAITGYGQPEDRERALAAGFDAHMAKPVDLDALEGFLARAPTSP